MRHLIAYFTIFTFILTACNSPQPSHKKVQAAKATSQSTMNHQHMMGANTPLTLPGNDVFGTIQEAVHKLEADSTTDWSKVNLEGLRQHLLDMKAFTEEVKVVEQKPIDKGIWIRVKPETARAKGALKRMFSMHPAMLKQEKGWDMTAEKEGDDWVINCTTENTAEVAKVRGLGYIGLLAEGAHHQMHHWMIVKGNMQMH